jgi:5-methylcytosine-specific restriction endonuclease McrA
MNADRVPLPLQRRVRDRAGGRCEYCGISQVGQEATFHVDHVRPRRDGGATVLGNLALACVSCSLRKGARTTGTDPETGGPAEVFNPRTNRWSDHFRVADDFAIVGLTSVGRASVQLLGMNRPLAVDIRREEAARGRYPAGA